ncbi:unknown [Firmicutes bacterium CAG:884]|nr:hypothetical protein [Bacillota bacterium]CCY94452.1 unknown [Firmicutes bacterium CAG:884]
MHIENFDDKLIIYINKKINLEEISNVLLKSKALGLDIKLYDNIVLYEDEILGTILELTNENDSYFTTFDMNISLSKEKSFLLKIEENADIDIKKDIYKYKNNYYMQIKENDFIKIGRLLEYSKIIYGSIVKKIKKTKNKVNGGIVV